jgi:NADPH:quinone reductase-like Zn-dependent oxidoreductase
VTEDHKLIVSNIDIPVPASGQVLVKMEYAPINPSNYNILFIYHIGDTYFIKGLYDESKDRGHVHYPFVPGWEGSGTVI